MFKTANELYKEEEELRKALKTMRLTDLLALNPTLEDLRNVFVLMHGPSRSGVQKEQNIQWIQALLSSQEIKPKLQENKRASAGKFRLLLLIDSETYQLGEDQNNKIAAIRLFAAHGKSHPGYIYNDRGELEMELAH